jgi:hypothetical protein
MAAETAAEGVEFGHGLVSGAGSFWRHLSGHAHIAALSSAVDVLVGDSCRPLHPWPLLGHLAAPWQPLPRSHDG